MPSNFIKNVRAKRSGKNIQSGSIAGEGSYVGVSSEGLLVLTSSAGGGGGGGGVPGGADTQIQYNDGGAFSGSADLTYDSSTGLLTASSGVYVAPGGILTVGSFGATTLIADNNRVTIAQKLSLFGSTALYDDRELRFGNTTDAIIRYASADEYLHISGSSNGIALSGSSVVVDGDLIVNGSPVGGTGLMDTSQDFTNPVQPDFLANGDMNGDIIKFGTNATVLSTLYFLSGSANSWQTASAVHTTSSGPVLLALAAGTGPGTDGMLLRGFARIPAALLPGNSAANLGAPVYVSTGSGELTFTAPSTSGDVVRIVGYSVSTPFPPFVDTIIYFNPDATWVDIT